MAEFGLVRSFDIDHGQLDHVSRQTAFVLGYELASIDSELKSGRAISRTVHADNRSRIEKACRDSGREYRISWMPGDKSESWLELYVKPKN